MEPLNLPVRSPAPKGVEPFVVFGVAGHRANIHVICVVSGHMKNSAAKELKAGH